MSFKDFYGNETQQDTPTTMLLKDRRKSKVESEGKFHLSVNVFPEVTAKLAVNALQKTIDNIQEYNRRNPDAKYTFKVEVTQK